MEKLSRKIGEDYPVYPEKVLQFGEGNFLRAFVDWQLYVLNKETNFNGSVVVVQPKGTNKIVGLNEQEGLFTLYLQGMKENKAVNEHMIVDTISRGIDLFTDYHQYIELAHSEELRFVISNTTEAGIYFEPTDRLEDRPQISFPGKLTAFLFHRFQAFNGDQQKGCIVIPCELIEENGIKLREIVLQYAELWNLGEEFVSWIMQNNTFCNSLVDRIVPGFPKDNIDEITEELGYQDDLVVVGEQYHQWVIEGPQWIKDEFPIDQVALNTFIVDDLTPYRTQKVRILNGAHTAMTPIGYLAGLETVSEAVEDEEVGRYIHELIYEEIVPTLNSDVKVFANDVINRFRNPYFKHYLLSISLNSISKFTARILPTLLDYLEKKKELPQRIVFSLAALLHFYRGKREDDAAVLDWFVASWKAVDEQSITLDQFVQSCLSNQCIWGMDLTSVDGLTELVTEYLDKIEQAGMRDALMSVNKEGIS
ncbi:tagaturonate reductase [Peribacillus psychrosaccharolyticus]|uniref:Tagaturonate reductase n=1 Tax=Peribacillus psychrosaccharolyticus TaxID=1407 RepID=A0A974RZY4_PERPY|nr:tagaturonate reductase [Peribacillus psychrosaccharolyticus]MEC2054450.1 tagaturonate reductase [Peribacillus psychrosaccharolyticus]MED3744323.1 tagaturonate reductase [Peribacillus psychrosaccharolyticus]QQS99802.1 tagaturonate reductase [Peribacillus psychrosaccharolyticus]